MEKRKDFTKEVVQELKEVENVKSNQNEVNLAGISEMFGPIATYACC